MAFFLPSLISVSTNLQVFTDRSESQDLLGNPSSRYRLHATCLQERGVSMLGVAHDDGKVRRVWSGLRLGTFLLVEGSLLSVERPALAFRTATMAISFTCVPQSAYSL